MDPESHQSLLDKRSRSTKRYHWGNEHGKQHWRRKWLFWIFVAVGHVFVSLATVAILLHIPAVTHSLTTTTSSNSNVGSYTNDLLFNGALHFSTIQPGADAWKHSEYTGSPSHSSDAAWEELQKVRGVAITPDQASSLNIPKTGLSAGNGTTATLLGVQHNLHCIRYIRQVLHPTYYYPNQNPNGERKERVMHAGHCLEALRQSIMCTPDLTPRGVVWEDEERGNIAVNPSVKLECLNWESLVEWMEERTYTLDNLWEANPYVGGEESKKKNSN